MKPCNQMVEGLSDSFIAWYKDHSMMTSLKKALQASQWMEQMIQEFKQVYIRKYSISQGYAARYPEVKLSDDDELEGDGLADLLGPLVKTSLKDSERDAEGPTLERAAKKGRARKTDPPEPSRRQRKKTVKCKKGQDDDPEPATSKPPPEKKPKGERKKKRQVETGMDELIPRKKKSMGTPSATLRRAPDAEPSPMPEVLLGATPMAEEKKTSLDEQLEAHLLGAEPLTTVVQPSQTAASHTTPQGPDMGGFLARLRRSIPRAGTQQAVATIPVPRQSKQTWIPVPVAEAQTTKPPTVRELLAKQATKEIPRVPTLDTQRPTTWRSPTAREVSTMETGGGKSPPLWTWRCRRSQQCPRAEQRPMNLPFPLTWSTKLETWR